MIAYFEDGSGRYIIAKVVSCSDVCWVVDPRGFVFNGYRCFCGKQYLVLKSMFGSWDLKYEVEELDSWYATERKDSVEQFLAEMGYPEIGLGWTDRHDSAV